MARTLSQMIELGTPAPDFDLPAVYPEEKNYTLADFDEAEALVFVFMCNHCPYVQVIEDRLIEVARQYGPKGVRFVGICANDAALYPDDAPDALARRAKQKNYPFPYLHDESQDVAKAFGAVCTPDFFVYNRDRRLAYRGRLDDVNPSHPNRTTNDLPDALDELLATGRVTRDQIPSMGCNIKWK